MKKWNKRKTTTTNCSNIQRITPSGRHSPSGPPGRIRHPPIHPLLVEIAVGTESQKTLHAADEPIIEVAIHFFRLAFLRSIRHAALANYFLAAAGIGAAGALPLNMSTT